MFIHIRPDEVRTLARIPKKFLFAAPGRPLGHKLMGYNDRGECPMLVENKCSIYLDRPQTCRDYDCRVYAAAGTLPDESTQPVIAERVRAWKFATPDALSKSELDAVRASSSFLNENEHLFPDGVLPQSLAQRAILALRVHKLFLRDEPHRGDVEIVALICGDIADLSRG